MTKITALDAAFCANVDFVTGSFYEQQNIEGAQGVMFQCPLCGKDKEPVDTGTGRRGVCGAHYIICWFRNPHNAPVVPDELEPRPGRWDASGSSLADLTLNPSVNLDVNPTAKSCKWHGWVKNGDAV